jgi:predicted heme/steroid binding protein
MPSRKDVFEMKPLRLFAVAAALLLASCAGGVSSSSSQSSSSSSSVSSSSTSSSVTSQSSSELRVFTLVELAQYDGDNGSLAYMAVNGIVYDVTNADEWNNGWHKGMHLAGTDATAAFADSPHSASILNTLTIVGTLEN